MAARKRKTALTETWKARISATKLSLRLYQHAHGEVEMSNSQVKAAQILLGKMVPDLARTEHVGDSASDPINHVWTIEMVRAK